MTISNRRPHDANCLRCGAGFVVNFYTKGPCLPTSVAGDYTACASSSSLLTSPASSRCHAALPLKSMRQTAAVCGQNYSGWVAGGGRRAQNCGKWPPTAGARHILDNARVGARGPTCHTACLAPRRGGHIALAVGNRARRGGRRRRALRSPAEHVRFTTLNEVAA
jgi:hypothetical protein